MPELPEVETIVRGLRPHLIGRTVAAVRHVSAHLAQRDPDLPSLRGETITAIDRRAKYIIMQLSSGRRLLVHLRMSGRLQVKEKSARKDKHDHVVVTFVDSEVKLVFRDVRKFGLFEFVNGNNAAGLELLGPEATAITAAELVALCQSSSRPIKTLLLDQHRIAGLGNIYVDESLHRARIHPLTPAARISRRKVADLAAAIRLILRQAIRYMGTTFDSYRGADGSSGRYFERLRAYGQTGELCSCGRARIARTVVGGRGTHFCPHCQRLPNGRRRREA
ncbi:MAG: bifunctional DNA-formamidopyrimidine glycosylase/DNA-(apurinic or apyrimidinic site) lyase [bacterium]